MCLRPIKIKNNSLDFVKGRDADFFYVPCGKCFECRNSKRNDYTFRCVAEMMSTNSQVFYYTLTFNDEHLPKATIPNGYTMKFEEIVCFDKPLVQKFIKRLRKYLFKTYGIVLKYFLSSEFGEKLKRPHHHVLFFFTKWFFKSFFV